MIEPIAADAELLEVVDHHAGVLAGDVAEDHVAGRLARRPGQVDQIAGRGSRLEQVECLLRPIRGDDHPQVNHRRSVSAPLVARTSRLGSCSPTTTCTCAQTKRGRRRSATSRQRTSSATSPRRPRPGSRSSASPSTSIASARRSSSGATPSGRSRRATTSTPTASSCAGHRCVSGSSATSSPAPRTAPRTCSRPATSTTWSARSTSSATSPSTTRDSTPGSGPSPTRFGGRYFETLAECARSGLFDILAHPDLVKVWGGARPLPDRDPRHFYEPAVEAIGESGIAVEISTAGLRKPVGELYPAPAFAEMCVEAGAAIRALLRRPPPRAGRLRL